MFQSTISPNIYSRGSMAKWILVAIKKQTILQKNSTSSEESKSSDRKINSKNIDKTLKLTETYPIKTKSDEPNNKDKNDTTQKSKLTTAMRNLPLHLLNDTNSSTKKCSNSMGAEIPTFTKRSLDKGNSPPKSSPISISGSSSNIILNRLKRSDSLSPKQQLNTLLQNNYSIESVFYYAKQPLAHTYLNQLSNSTLKKILAAAMEYVNDKYADKDICASFPVPNHSEQLKDSQGKNGETYSHYVIYIKKNNTVSYYLRDYKTKISKGAQGELEIVYKFPCTNFYDMKKEDKFHEHMINNAFAAKISVDSVGKITENEIENIANVYKNNSKYLKYIDHGILEIADSRYSCFISEYLYAVNALKCFYQFDETITDKDSKERIIGRRYLPPEFIFKFWIKLLECYLVFQRKYSHRDIKPENIMLEPNEDGFNAIIIDYDDVTTCEMSKKIRGTTIYKDPLILENKTSTKRNDLYSIGVTLCESITNENLQVNIINEQTEIANRKLERQNFEKELYKIHNQELQLIDNELEKIDKSLDVEINILKNKREEHIRSGAKIPLQFGSIKDHYDQFSFEDVQNMQPDIFQLLLLSEVLAKNNHYYSWLSLTHDEMIGYLEPVLKNIVGHDRKLLCNSLNNIIELFEFLLHSQPILQEIANHFMLANPNNRPNTSDIKHYIKNLYTLMENHKERTENCKKYYYNHNVKFKMSQKDDPLGYIPSRERIKNNIDAIQRKKESYLINLTRFHSDSITTSSLNTNSNAETKDRLRSFSTSL